MTTKIITSPKEAAELLLSGGLVAFATETVYGLGAVMQNEQAVKNIFLAKGRPNDNPLILHIPTFNDILPLINPTDKQLELLKKLYSAFCPAPLTFILPKSDLVPKYITGGRETVAVRVPKNDLTLEFLKLVGEPVPAPSANISGTPSPTKAEHVYNDLNGKIDAILDGGQCEAGLESTIVDLTVSPAQILRHGAITIEMIRELIPDIGIYKGEEIAKAPGMKYRHYAPKAELIKLAPEQKPEAGEDIVCISRNKYEGVTNLFSGYTDSEFAHNLYNLFRKADELNAKKIYIETPDSETGIAKGIITRINKAIESSSEVIIVSRKREDISKFVKDKIMGKVLLAKMGSEIVGVLEYLENDLEIEVLNIIVREDKRKRGIGKELINALPNKKRLLEVRESNKIAQEFYKKLGFIENGQREKYYDNKEDAKLMEKENINNG